LSHAEKIEYLLAQRALGEKVIAICQQYGIAESTFYYWLSRYSAHGTFENLSRAPLTTYPKVTQEVKDEVIKTHKANPKLGCWRLSLFDYDGPIKLGHHLAHSNRGQAPENSFPAALHTDPFSPNLVH